MNKLFIVIILLFTWSNFYTQKIKEKKGRISVDGIEILDVEKISVAGNWDFSIRNLGGEELAFFTMKEYKDKREISDSSPKGRVVYYQISISGVDGMAESSRVVASKKGVAKFLIKNNVINGSNGQVDLQFASTFIERLGQDHTRRRDELYGNQNVIIINNNTPAPKEERDGITLKKGNVKVNIGN